VNVGALELLVTLAGTAGDCAAVARSAGVLLDEWQYACLGLADGQRLVAAMPEAGNWARDIVPADEEAPGPSLPVRVWGIRGADVLWETRVTLAGGDDAEVAAALDRAEEWSIGVATVRLGREPGIRLSARLRWGEDFSFEREIVALLTRPSGDAPAHVLWTGAGSLTEDRRGTCVLQTRARFQLVQAGTTLERRYAVRRQLPKPQVSPPVAADLRRRCLARAVPSRRFPVRSLASR
jgi:hypothetical protein